MKPHIWLGIPYMLKISSYYCTISSALLICDLVQMHSSSVKHFLHLTRNFRINIPNGFPVTQQLVTTRRCCFSACLLSLPNYSSELNITMATINTEWPPAHTNKSYNISICMGVDIWLRFPRIFANKWREHKHKWNPDMSARSQECIKDTNGFRYPSDLLF